MKKILLLIIVCFTNICTYAQINVSKADALIKTYIISKKSAFSGCNVVVSNVTFDCLTYEIISASGAVLQNGELLPSIDISRLPQGAKFIVVKNDNGEIVYLNKFIKQ